MMKLKALTLAELLIALAILGVIATFTVPKVLQSENDARKKAILKETIAALSGVAYQGRIIDGELKEGNSISANQNYVLDHLNAVKICKSNIVSDGCWPGGLNYANNLYSETTLPGMVFHNGAVIVLFTPQTKPDGFIMAVSIDWNGIQGPNLYNKDVYHYYMGIGNDPSAGWKPGTIKACCDPNSPSATYIDFW